MIIHSRVRWGHTTSWSHTTIVWICHRYWMWMFQTLLLLLFNGWFSMIHVHIGHDDMCNGVSIGTTKRQEKKKSWSRKDWFDTRWRRISISKRDFIHSIVVTEKRWENKMQYLCYSMLGERERENEKGWGAHICRQKKVTTDKQKGSIEHVPIRRSWLVEEKKTREKRANEREEKKKACLLIQQNDRGIGAFVLTSKIAPHLRT